MCLIVFAYGVHPEYPLVLVANRDENYGRPTRQADWWPETPGLVGGKDLLSGGSWLGVTQQGRWAAVTNYRENLQYSLPSSTILSRGELVSGYLEDGSLPPYPYVSGLVEKGEQYGGFNLLVGDLSELAYCSNRGLVPQKLTPGVYTLSNHLLNTPWPKSEQARFKLEHQLRMQQLSVESLMTVLADKIPVDDHHLPDTGVGLTTERILSSAFISTESYGTRCTSVLLINKRREVIFAEQNFMRGEKEGGLRLFQFEV